jgi:hypothetical protein
MPLPVLERLLIRFVAISLQASQSQLSEAEFSKSDPAEHSQSSEDGLNAI